MLLRKQWVAMFLCSLALLVAFSVSTEPVHAANRISHEQLNTSIRHGGPPGCNDLIFLNVKSTGIISYAGHKFIVEQQLLGWYTTLENGTNVFCDQIICQSSVYPATNSTVPPGYLGIECGNQSDAVNPTERIAGGSGITPMQVTVDASGSVISCAQYRPYGGSINTVGWGCAVGYQTYPVPSEIF
jgi:hypothetical protein